MPARTTGRLLTDHFREALCRAGAKHAFWRWIRNGGRCADTEKNSAAAAFGQIVPMVECRNLGIPAQRIRPRPRLSTARQLNGEFSDARKFGVRFSAKSARSLRQRSSLWNTAMPSFARRS